MKAIWNNEVIAESDATVVVEGNHYFPADSIKNEFFTPSETHTVCGWKGTCSSNIAPDCGDEGAMRHTGLIEQPDSSNATASPRPAVAPRAVGRIRAG